MATNGGFAASPILGDGGTVSNAGCALSSCFALIRSDAASTVISSRPWGVMAMSVFASGERQMPETASESLREFVTRKSGPTT